MYAMTLLSDKKGKSICVVAGVAVKWKRANFFFHVTYDSFCRVVVIIVEAIKT